MDAMILVGIFLCGAFAAGQINRAIYRWAYHQRSISPWSPPVSGAVPRRHWHRIPLVGWFGIRGDQQLHGQGFWWRPWGIELAFPLGLVLLYLSQTQGGLLPIGAIPEDQGFLVKMRFVFHSAFLGLLVIATFIDVDEKTIPDLITLPGCLGGLLWAAAAPAGRLPAWYSLQPPVDWSYLHVGSPEAWSSVWDGAWGAGIAWLGVIGWWYAYQPKTLWYRSGARRFWQFWWASMWRDPRTPWWGVTALAVGASTTWVWLGGGPRWESLFSAWVGLLVGGGMVWLVRVVASWALAQEAMGFGDVTLMAMIGACMGWQPAMLVFFLAPFTGVGIAVIQWMTTGRKDIAFGPFLCVSAAAILFGWPLVWSELGIAIFSLGLLIPITLTVCLVLLGGILWGLAVVRQIFFPQS